jgi:hypothetical protein
VTGQVHLKRQLHQRRGSSSKIKLSCTVGE